MEPIRLNLIDANCKPVHARAYTVLRSVEQLQQSKETLRLVDIGVLGDYSSEWVSSSPSLAIHKKNGSIRVVNFSKLNL
jgi:hypothetical protein